VGRVKINFLDVLEKYEYLKGKCVQSVLGELNSKFSICCNKGTQSDLEVPFLPTPQTEVRVFFSGSVHNITADYLGEIKLWCC